jgi:hypothetical protein
MARGTVFCAFALEAQNATAFSAGTVAGDLGFINLCDAQLDSSGTQPARGERGVGFRYAVIAPIAGIVPKTTLAKK